VDGVGSTRSRPSGRGERLHAEAPSDGARSEADAPSADRLRPWLVATREAALVAVLGLALGLAVSFLLAAGIPGLGVIGAVRGGVVLFMIFHHVGIQAAMASLHLPHGAEVPLGLPTGYAVDATVALALLGGTALLLWRLGRAGALVAQVTGGRPRNRGFSGARVAIPYALMTFLLGWTVHATVRFPQTPPVDLHPSHVASLMWPLALAVVAGFVGGVRSGPDGVWGSEWWESDEWSRRWRGAFSGAVRMLLVGMAVSLVGFVLVAGVRIGDTVQYASDALSGGPVAGLGVAALAVLALPNLALWTMAPAFGGCIQIASGFGFTSGPYCALSYGNAPSHILAGRDIFWGLPDLGPPPAALWLFLLVPVVAVVVGTLHGVRVGEARTGREGALLGLLTGGVFVGLFLMALLLSTVTVRLVGPISYIGAGYFRYGPQPLDAIQLGITWAVLGGLFVGWLAGRRAGRVPAGGDAAVTARA
jgi:hypothetical protein